MLNLTKVPTNTIDAEVTGLGGEIVNKIDKAISFTLTSKRDKSFSIKVTALVVLLLLEKLLVSSGNHDADGSKKGQLVKNNLKKRYA